MTVTGRPWDELEDTLTWPRLTALGRYWADHPPVHELVAAFMGVKPADRPTTNFEEFLAMFDDGVMR